LKTEAGIPLPFGKLIQFAAVENHVALGKKTVPSLNNHRMLRDLRAFTWGKSAKTGKLERSLLPLFALETGRKTGEDGRPSRISVFFEAFVKWDNFPGLSDGFDPSPPSGKGNV
jgi:hypothetical protein